MKELNKNKNFKTYCLFSGRHDLPENQGALFDSFDFENFVPIGTKKFDEVINKYIFYSYIYKIYTK